MIERTNGIILRQYPLTETSLVLHWLTADFGRIATVAKGARRPKSPFRGKLDLFYLAEFTFRRSRQSELHTLQEVRVLETHTALRRDVHLLQQAAYCAALIQQHTETDTPMPEMFRLMLNLLRQLISKPPKTQTILAFELKFLNELGLTPSFGKEEPELHQAIKTLTASEWEAAVDLQLSPSQIHEITKFLRGFLMYHLGKIPAGRDEALKLQ